MGRCFWPASQASLSIKHCLEGPGLALGLCLSFDGSISQMRNSLIVVLGIELTDIV